MIFTSDGSRSYTFYNYEQGGMNRAEGTQFIGYINNGLAVGIADSKDGSFLRAADENLKFGSMSIGSPATVDIRVYYNTQTGPIFIKKSSN